LAHAALLAPRVMVANDIAPKPLPGREDDTSKSITPCACSVSLRAASDKRARPQQMKAQGTIAVSERHDDGIPSAFGADMAGMPPFIAEVGYIGDGLNRPDQNRLRARRLVRSGDKVASNGRRFQRGKQTRRLFRVVQHVRPAQNRI